LTPCRFRWGRLLLRYCGANQRDSFDRTPCELLVESPNLNLFIPHLIDGGTRDLAFDLDGDFIVFIEWVIHEQRILFSVGLRLRRVGRQLLKP
jgi:hypothetical protein